MDFWRSGRARSHRTQPAGGSGSGSGGPMQRIRNIYFPPWVPVAAIIVLVFGILGLLFITRSATGAPRIGEDHWHASYTFFACGEKQPNAPTWEGVGVHTHGDGIVHIHPFTASEEGSGARLVKWFEYGGGKLSDDEIQMPGFVKAWKNGEVCPDGTEDAGKEGVVQVFVNGAKLSDWDRYIPKDGDRIRMVFGPEESTIQLDDRQVIPEDEAERDVTIEIGGNENTTAFTPAAINVDAGETIKIIVNNTADVSHGMRIAGPDGEYDTADDFVAVPEGSDPTTAEQGDAILPESSGFVVVRFDEAGQIEFKDPTATDISVDPPEPFATGTIIVGDSTTPTPAPDEVDQQVEVVMKDSIFEPDEITLEAGVKFGIDVPNQGIFVHNLRIAGPDGEYDTDDDIVSEDVSAGETGRAIGTLDDPGEYDFRCDFHPQTQTGTLTIE
jgi:plastocyanin